MVGVPCLEWWPAGPSSRMCWPNSCRRRKAIERRPGDDPEQHRDHSRRQHELHCERLDDRLEPRRAAGLHEHRVARPSTSASPATRRAASANQRPP